MLQMRRKHLSYIPPHPKEVKTLPEPAILTRMPGLRPDSGRHVFDSDSHRTDLQMLLQRSYLSRLLNNVQSMAVPFNSSCFSAPWYAAFAKAA